MTSEKSITESPQENNITIEELRSIPDFANFSDDELHGVAESIKELALLLNTMPMVGTIFKK